MYTEIQISVFMVFCISVSGGFRGKNSPLYLAGQRGLCQVLRLFPEGLYLLLYAWLQDALMALKKTSYRTFLLAHLGLLHGWQGAYI